MSLFEFAKLALSSLLAHRLRSSLTMLGIAIGIASVIGLLALGEAAKFAAIQEISKLGTNLIFVRPGEATSISASKGKGSATTLTYDDAIALKDFCPAVQEVAAEFGGSFQVECGSCNTNTQVAGVDASYSSVRNFKTAKGRFFTQNEVAACSQVCTLGTTVAETLFTGESETALDKTIFIKGQAYKVIGIMESKGSGPMGDSDDQIILPITSGYLTLFGTNNVTGRTVKSIYVTALPSKSGAAQFQIINLLRLRHNLTSEKDDFILGSQKEILQTADKITNLFSALLTVIAIISLTVGAIGIMNIMLVTVSERTREIGIRIAVGASFSDIVTQFLMESIFLSMCGGAIGIVTGVVFSLTATAVMKLPPTITISSVLLSFFLSLAVGVVSGIYPARRAALLNPVEALRG